MWMDPFPLDSSFLPPEISFLYWNLCLSLFPSREILHPFFYPYPFFPNAKPLKAHSFIPKTFHPFNTREKWTGYPQINANQLTQSLKIIKQNLPLSS